VSGEAGAGLTLKIDLGALARNWARLSSMSAPAECAAVVKAEAYGIGIDQAVPALWNAGCRTFFVALPEEGRRVRAVAPEAIIYVLAGFTTEALPAYLDAELRPVLNHADELSLWAGFNTGRAAALHVDTGMNRLGLPVERAIALSGSDLISRANVQLLISHLACADEPENPHNAAQLARFRETRAKHPSLSASFANSAGIMLGADYRFDLVRPGIALYGGACGPRINTEQVVTAEARILQVRHAAAGETVGYGSQQTLKRQSRLAVIAAGYADGYPRAAGSSDERSGASVFVAGRRAPLVGRVSMDLVVADVTDVPDEVRVGDRAELFGSHIPIDDVAATAGTIGYELLTRLSRRAERIYVNAPEAV
jgi:alanine racemase